MLRNFPLPPPGGLCTDQPTQFFSEAETEEDINAGLAICKQCPILQECWEWVRDCIEEDNRDRPRGLPERIPVSGVIASRYYKVTDQEGTPIHIQTLRQQMKGQQ